MPPYKKKRRYLQNTKTQTKRIESRLMEISIKIDNYIYKNHPISLPEAALCIEEVSSYKYQYAKDPRIFQVTEKLIRQLKGVIEEQDTTYSWNVTEVIENSMAVCPSSPTYSEREISVVKEQDPLRNDNMIGRDNYRKGGKKHNAMTLDILRDDILVGRDDSRKGGKEHNALTLDILRDDILLDGDKSRKRGKEDNAFALDLSLIKPMVETNITLEVDSQETNTGKRMNNRSNRDELSYMDSVGDNIPVTKAQIHTCNSPIKDIQRSLSQLAIKTANDEKQTTITLRSVRKVSKGSTSYNQYFTGLKMPSSYDCKFNHQDGTGITQVSNGTVLTKTIRNNQSICEIQQIQDTLPQNIPKKRRERRKAVPNQTELNDSLKEKPKRRRKSKALKTQKNNDITVNDIKRIPVCTSYPTNNNTLSNLMIEKPSNVQRDPLWTVYSNNVVNDLSWIENIRYIREVAPDEIDHKLKYYDNSFWDTFELPANWNDQDFLY